MTEGSRTSPAEVGPWSAADSEPLFEIYQRIFGDRAATARRASWEWQYRLNPHGSDGTSVWVARRDGRPIGNIGSIPVAMWWEDREIRASWATDYFVAPEAEGLGDSITLLKTWMRSVDLALVLGLAPTSYLICKRMGFRDLGFVPLFQFVLDPAAIAGRRWGRAARVLAAPFSAAWKRNVRRRLRRVGREVELCPVEAFGEDYDALWLRARAGFAMCVRRDAAYLTWRYRGAPNKRYDVVEARRGGSLAGFVVSRHEDYRGLRLGWIVDLFAAADDRAARDALLAHTMDALSRAGVARVQAYATSDRLGGDLRRFGFFKSASPAHLVARPNGVTDGPVGRPGDWHVVFGDSDSDR